MAGPRAKGEGQTVPGQRHSATGEVPGLPVAEDSWRLGHGKPRGFVEADT